LLIALSIMLTACGGQQTTDDKSKTPSKPAATADAAQKATPKPVDNPPAAADAGAASVVTGLPDAGAVVEGDKKHTLKNITTLPKTWTWDQVHDYMEDTVSQGLGQKCSFCHKKGDFAADTDEKKTAREMMTMVAGLNQKYFAGKDRVTCMTCHNGKKEPAKP
jgi:hypothetical protein